MRFKHKAIAPTPHAEYTQCMQCHVKRDDGITPWRENTFVGLDFPGKGEDRLAPGRRGVLVSTLGAQLREEDDVADAFLTE